jgi:hypothetical protein
MSRLASATSLDPDESTIPRPPPSDQEQPMPKPRAAAATTRLRAEPTLSDVIALLERYAAADRDLAAELDRIGAEVSSSRRVSHATVTRLQRLLEDSLVPGVQAKSDLDELPTPLRRAGIARWAQRAIQRVQCPTEESA